MYYLGELLKTTDGNPEAQDDDILPHEMSMLTGTPENIKSSLQNLIHGNASIMPQHTDHSPIQQELKNDEFDPLLEYKVHEREK